MRLLKTEREEVAGVAQRWKSQYCVSGDWAGGQGNEREKYDALVAISTSGTAADVARIIGNDSWIGEDCNECGKHTAVILIGEEPDYESATVYLCLPCAKRAVELAQSADAVDPHVDSTDVGPRA